MSIRLLFHFALHVRYNKRLLCVLTWLLLHISQLKCFVICIIQLCLLIAIHFILFCFPLDFAPCLIVIHVIFSSLRNKAQDALFQAVHTFGLSLHSCPCFASLPATCVWYIRCACRKETENCMCCSSWLQYRICHSLSTIQYVLVPQVQRQLQSARLRTSESSPGSRSR